MQGQTKRKLEAITKLIKSQQYKQALQDAQILVLKQPKLLEGHLLAGMCYQKLKRWGQAEKQYLQVEDLKPQDTRALKKLCQIYHTTERVQKETEYLQKLAKLLKGKDQIKYRQSLVKLIGVYIKDQNLQKIDEIFNHYVLNQDQIGDDFVKIADGYFRVGVINKCFNLQKFQLMGLKGEVVRTISKSARQPFNYLLIDLHNYIVAASKQYNYDQKVISNSLFEMKIYFPDASCLLMLFLLDQYCVAHVGFSSIIIQQIYKLVISFYDGVDNLYSNMQHTSPQMFGVCMILGYEYISFFNEFFTLDEILKPYLDKLATDQNWILKIKIRQDYMKKIQNFLMHECKLINRISQSENVERRLQQLKYRIKKLPGSFLQEVVAKMAMNCFSTYKKLDQMKNLLKLRIKNSPQPQVHLYKYYYDYLIKIAKIFKALDQQISIYQVIQNINKLDPSDLKYQIQHMWLQFSKLISQSQQAFKYANQFLIRLNEYMPNLSGIVKSDSLRKRAILKLMVGEKGSIQDLQVALSIDRSVQNLECMGLILYQNKQYSKSLTYLKQAFIINQKKYHLNRTIFLCMLKCDKQAQARQFIQRIFQGFSQIFWVNYTIGLKKTNQKRFQEAQDFLSRAMENFLSCEKSKAFRASYAKTIQYKQYSYLYMINQNSFDIIFDQIILPEEQVNKFYPLCGFNYIIDNHFQCKLRLWTQLAQILKILGRTKSSFNYLSEIYLFELNQNYQKDNPQLLFQVSLMKKEYATILFYMRMFKESEVVLLQAHNILQNQIVRKLGQIVYDIQSEITALFFQISLEKLSLMVKFDSYESVQTYIQQFRAIQPIKSSLNLLKSQYQFYILSYLHSKKNAQRAYQAIYKCLAYFGLNFQKINDQSFQNKMLELDIHARKTTKECLEDLLVLKYIHQPQSLKEQHVMQLIQLFPQSTIFYIVYGMTTKDVKLKIASFLRCIQIDKQSPISIQLLGSLYLKENNYLGACKLFLKSLQMDIMNPRCYLGLAISLYAIVNRSLAKKDPKQQILIQKCMGKISSYMEYLRCTDPSDNYQLLNFYSILLSDKKQQIFKIKSTLEISTRLIQHYSKQSIFTSLLQESALQLTNKNVWKKIQFPEIIINFISSITSELKISPNLDISIHLLKQNKKNLKELINNAKSISKQLLEKKSCLILTQVSISLNIALTKPYNAQLFLDVTSLLQQFSTLKLTITQQNQSLNKKIKQYLMDYVFLSYEENNRIKVQKIFPQILTFNYIVTKMSKLPSFQIYLSKSLLKYPSNQYLNRISTTYLIIKGRHFQKHQLFNYQTQILNDLQETSQQILKKSYLKIIALNRDSTAWGAYIELLWRNPKMRTQQNVTQWIKIINRLTIKDNSQKLRNLKIQMMGFCIYQFNHEIKEINLTNDQSQDLQNFIMSLSIRNSDKISKIKQKLSKSSDQFTLACLSYIVNNFESDDKMEKLLEISQKKLTKQCIGIINLLKFIYCINRKEQGLQNSVKKIKYLSNIIDSCEGLVSQQTMSILKCTKHLLIRDFDELDNQLGSICDKYKIITYSDQIALNYFEIMRTYHECTIKGGQSGVIDNFMIFVTQMIDLVKEPSQKGFYLFLRGMIKSLTIPEGQSHFVMDLKKAKLISPTKMTLGQTHQ